MPAMLDDPTSPPIYRVSGSMPMDSANNRTLPSNIQPRQVTLRDRTTIASLIPFSSLDEVPPRLVYFLCDLLNSEIEKGDTYPMIESLSYQNFGPYWFSNFAAVMVMGEVASIGAVHEMESRGVEWKNVCLGSFYVKPNYPGRSSHVCNGGFLVSNASRNRGVGKLMGEGYLDWAPKLGYMYSVFNLVYETNHASIRIWDSLGFKRIGRVKGCGSLKSHPGTYVDAIIFGRDLGAESEDYVSEERFDKIRFYLKHQKYPVGADRAEKSRLRSAATHYHLVQGGSGEEEKLMLKDKEVIADTQKQYDIARQMHCQTHGGINKTTATIAEKYHWVRIKETVSLVIKNCPECKESSKITNSYTSKVDSIIAPSPSKAVPNVVATHGQQLQNLVGREITPPQSMGPPSIHQQHQQPLVQTPQPQHPNPLMTNYETSIHSMASETPVSRTPSTARQSPSNTQISSSAPASESMAPPMMHTQPPSPHSNTILTPIQALTDQMPQPLIPPHINNLNTHLGLTNANISQPGSTVHSPMTNGPASAPIGSIHNAFDMPLDPNLLAGLQNPAYSDLTSGSMDSAIQNMGNLDMDTNMHSIDDLNAMGLGDTSMHGLSDHGHISHGGHPPDGVGLSSMGQGHGVGPGSMLNHHSHQGQGDVKPELLGSEMMLDSDMRLGR